VIVMPAAHPWHARNHIDTDDLANESVLMLGAGHCFRDQVIDLCPACGHRSESEGNISKTLEGSSLETIRHMVATGMGITVLPCTAAGVEKYAQRLLSIKRFSAPAPYRTVALAWRKSFPRPRAIEALRQAIRTSELTCVESIAAG